MVAWSSILQAGIKPAQISALLKSPALLQQSKNVGALQLRSMSGHGPRKLHITPSRFQWNKFKDLVHFYLLLGLIPVGTMIFLVNVFIGPATLEPIPEDRRPECYEYYRHPITRFLSAYVLTSNQQDYEKACHEYDENDLQRNYRVIVGKCKKLQKERRDYEGWYYRPTTAKYIRTNKNLQEYLDQLND